VDSLLITVPDLYSVMKPSAMTLFSPIRLSTSPQARLDSLSWGATQSVAAVEFTYGIREGQ
jgi:hypothetical protein